MKKNVLLISVGLLFAVTTAHAQDKVETTLSADVVNHYIWRGTDCGNVSIQPTLGVAYKGLSLSAWGSVGLDKDDNKELDLTASYSVGGFSIVSPIIGLIPPKSVISTITPMAQAISLKDM